MELYDLLRQRRMVRHYTGEPVPRETLRRIAATVRRAPSGGFSQGQRVLVVDDPALLRQFASADAERPAGTEPWFESAAAQIFVMTREDDYHERYNLADKLEAAGGREIEWPVPFWHVDAGAALMLILLAAIEEGLGAAVYGIFGDFERELRSTLHIPDDFAIVAGITVGRPLPDPEWTKRSSRTTQRRKTVDELVHWNRWDELTSGSTQE
jgi:FMN reductase [NAD(P)H]